MFPKTEKNLVIIWLEKCFNSNSSMIFRSRKEFYYNLVRKMLSKTKMNLVIIS